jgi:all-trans-retinol 13,14-reductase
LNSPDGSAYGIKQKIGQFNVVGRLPLKNLYAAGQSAVLPGIIGSMMSSFIVGRNMMGKDRYGAFVNQGLCS